MHSLQWLVVEADDVDSAASAVQGLLEEEMGTGDTVNTWFDWFIVGGGRWNATDTEDVFGAYETKTNMIIAFEDNTNDFRAKIDTLVQNRITEYNQYLSEVKQIDIVTKLENYGGVMTYDHTLYPLARLLSFQDGNWDYDSKFYDLVHYSTNPTHILSKIDNGLGSNLFLVPVDFHH